MLTRNVVLTAHHKRIIESLLTSGRYQNASEVLREGPRLTEAREAARLHVLKQAVDAGFSDLDDGRYTAVEDDGLEALIENLGRRAKHRGRT